MKKVKTKRKLKQAKIFCECGEKIEEKHYCVYAEELGLINSNSIFCNCCSSCQEVCYRDV